jgi:hypothetical protein
MKRTGGMFYGHLRGSIGEIVVEMKALLVDLPWALITSVDSLSNLRDPLAWNAPKRFAIEGRPIGQAILVGTPAFLEAAAQGTFSGFDEVWFCEQKPASAPPPEAWLVGPRDVDVDVVSKASEWMVAETCQLAFGDGVGLNYLSRIEGIALKMENRASRSGGIVE